MTHSSADPIKASAPPGIALTVVGLAVVSAWTGAHAVAVWVVPDAMRRMVPFPYDLHVKHLLLYTMDVTAMTVCVFLCGLILGGALGAPRSRIAWVGLVAAVAVGGSAVAQRYAIEPRLTDAITSGRITYPIAPPVPEFDELEFRWKALDAAMLACGGALAVMLGRRILVAFRQEGGPRGATEATVSRSGAKS